ncbi:MAG: type II toxin-antitoxin system RelE/ParE family toxin [Vicingaceae bacterium]|nr:type II toxin-antitoxin system RelE/ParE family toxin [Vicingaceae bacterium]
MNVFFDKSFTKSIENIKDKKIKQSIFQFIESVKVAKSIRDIHRVKKIQGFKNYYRYRFGDYRIGFEQTDENTIVLIVVAKRNDIYKVFP